jgi:hypothetical protein
MVIDAVAPGRLRNPLFKIKLSRLTQKINPPTSIIFFHGISLSSEHFIETFSFSAIATPEPIRDPILERALPSSQTPSGNSRRDHSR